MVGVLSTLRPPAGWVLWPLPDQRANAQSLSEELDSREVTSEKMMLGSTGCLSFSGDNCPTSFLPTNALSAL